MTSGKTEQALLSHFTFMYDFGLKPSYMVQQKKQRAMDDHIMRPVFDGFLEK